AWSLEAEFLIRTRLGALWRRRRSRRTRRSKNRRRGDRRFPASMRVGGGRDNFPYSSLRVDIESPIRKNKAMHGPSIERAQRHVEQKRSHEQRQSYFLAALAESPPEPTTRKKEDQRNQQKCPKETYNLDCATATTARYPESKVG